MPAALERDSLIAHYRILSTLGVGGMGEVYEAHDEHLERAIALKVLPSELVQNEERVRRFVQEAKSASGLNHPNIVAIYDIGSGEPKSSGEPSTPSSPVHYIAMELVRGHTLRDKIHHEKASLKDLVRWLAQVAEGMAKAHAAGIIHRDLKPENVMINNDGYAKILDFGLAKLIERKSVDESAASSVTALRHNTREGAVLGTVGYMSPEQVQGKVVDARSDIFSFGCLLYEAAARKKPFDADSDVETMHQILNVQPTPVGEVDPKVPADLRKVIRRCLAKDPEKRYQSMKDLALELNELVDEFDQLSSSSPSLTISGNIAPLAPPARRWMIPAIVGLMVIAIAAASVLLLRRRPTAVPAVVSTKFTQLTDMGGSEEQPSLSPDGQFLAYAARSAPESSNRDIFLLRVGGRNPINLTKGVEDRDTQPAFSPDGQWIAFRSERSGGGIFVMGATGESVRRLTDFGFNPSWSPDGKRIVVSTETGNNPRGRTTVASLWTFDVQTREKKKIYDGDAVQPQWSPNGHRIAFWCLPNPGKGQRDILTIPAAGGAAVAVTDDPALDWSPAWAADGKSLFFASDRDGSMNVWRSEIDEKTGIPSGQPVALTTPSAFSAELSVARKTGQIAYAASNTQINIHKIGFDPQTLTVQGTDEPVTSGSTQFIDPHSSPDGSMLIMRMASGQEDIYTVRVDGTDLRKLTDDAAKDRGPRWSPDGKRIAFYSDRSGKYEIWTMDSEGGDLQQVTKTNGRSLWFPEWSPDGTRLLTHNETGSRIFDLRKPLPQTEGEILPLVEAGMTFRGASWSKDGKWLVGQGFVSGNEVPGTWIYSFEEKKYTKVADIGGIGPGRPAWLSDSQHIVITVDGRLLIVNRITREIKPLYQPRGYGAGEPVPSRDNRTIYFNTSIKEGDIWMATLQ